MWLKKSGLLEFEELGDLLDDDDEAQSLYGLEFEDEHDNFWNG
jgi:hypothetical protein